MARKPKVIAAPPEQLDFSRLSNDFCEAIGYGNGPNGWIGSMPFPGQGGFPGGFSIQQVSDSTTAFENLRWYYVSNFRQLLSEMYVELGLIQTIVNVPVDDGLRGGINLLSKQLDEEQIHELTLSMDRDDDINVAGWAAKWDRLYGGAGILILVDDQDPIDPFDIKSIGPDTPLEFRAVDMWELFWDKQNTEGYDPQIQSQDFEFYSYYSELVHKTRVMRLKGITAPSFTRPFFRGWGVSVVEALVRSMNQYLKATDLTFQVLDEFKVDVYKIKNLINTLLSPTGTTSIKQRVQMANWQKNYQHALVMDAEDEFDFKQVSFAGLAEAQEGIRMQVANDMRMPAIKLFGQSFSKGLGNSAQDEMENYNSMIEAEVRGKLKYHILRMCEIKCQKLFGFIPDDLELEFKPLRELSAMDQETVRTQKFTRLFQSLQAGAITMQEFRDAANKGQLFDVKLDTAADGININDPDDAGEDDASQLGDRQADLDFDEPAADSEDNRSVRADINVPSRTSMMAPGAKPKLPPNVDKTERLNPKKTSSKGLRSPAEKRNNERLSNPGDVDEALWAKAKEKCQKEYGHTKWAVVTTIYKDMGGKFHKEGK